MHAYGVGEADAALAAFAKPLGAETAPLRSAAGRVLAEPIRADRDYPPIHRVCMDGIALRREALARGRGEFRIAGLAKAGDAPIALEADSDCIEVMTGAPCPKGCDAVIPVERISRVGGRARVLDEAPAAWAHIQPLGSECRAGDILVPAGAPLTAPRAAIAASVGLASVPVRRIPRIRAIATGDELAGPGGAALPWQVRGSNLEALSALTRGMATVETARAGDEAGSLREAIRWGLEAADVLILSGGVSAGRFDLVPGALAAEGVACVFHRLLIKPGKPIWFGADARGVPVFGLPGNPVGFLTCLRRFALPLIRALGGRAPAAPPRAALTEVLMPHARLTQFLPVRISGGGEARLEPTLGSGDFAGLGRSDGFIEAAPGMEPMPARAAYPYYPWET